MIFFQKKMILELNVFFVESYDVIPWGIQTPAPP